MSSHDSIPMDPDQLMAYCRNFEKQLGLYTTSIGGKPPLFDHIPNADVTMYSQEVEMHEVHYKAYNGGDCSKSEAKDYYESRDRIRGVTRTMINSYLLYHHRVKDSDRVKFGVNIHSTTSTPIPASVVTPVLGSVEYYAENEAIVHVKDPDVIPPNEPKKSRAFKVLLVGLEGDEGPWGVPFGTTDARMLKKFKRFRGKKIRVKIPGSSGKTVLIAFYFENEKGDQGPVSKVYKVNMI